MDHVVHPTKPKKLTDLVFMLDTKTSRFERMVKGKKTDPDRKLIQTIKRLHRTVSHPGDHADFQSVVSVADDLLEAITGAEKMHDTDPESEALREIRTLATEVVQMI